MIKIYIIIGSTRKNRFGEKPANWILDELKKMKNVEAGLIDLRDWPLPFYNEELSPIALAGNYTEPLAKKWAKKINQADGFIIATPEYNHGYPAVLKNALDWLYFEWNNKPVGFVSWGGVSGARSVEQLRQVAIELQMFPIRNSIHIKNFMAEDTFDSLKGPVKVFFDHLIWLTNVLKSARDQNPPVFL